MTSFVCRTLKCFPRQVLNYSTRQLLRHSPVLLLKRPKSSESNLSPAETAARTNWKCRQDLATAFRGLDFYGMGEGVCTHLTMIAPALNGDGDVMLMIPHGLHWSQVCSNLVHLCDMLVCVIRINDRPSTKSRSDKTLDWIRLVICLWQQVVAIVPFLLIFPTVS